METLIWLLMIIECYKLAKDKNRDEIWWIIGGIFFGVFAVIALLILPRKEE